MTGPFEKYEPVLGLRPESVNISNSEIQTYKQCRRKWMLGNYFGFGPKVDSKQLLGPLPLGTRIHHALELLYAEGENPVDTYNRDYNKELKAFLLTNPDEDEVKKFQSEGDLGRIMVEGYLDWVDEEGVDVDIEYYENESQLSYNLTSVDDRVNLIGKVDAKVRNRDSGKIRILDFKTAAAGNFGQYETSAFFSEQLRHYLLLEMLCNPEVKLDGGIYRVLKKVKRSGTAKPPFYSNVEMSYNKKDLESFWYRRLGEIRDMMDTRDKLDAGEDHRYVAYPTQKMDWTCSACPFYKMCSLMDDGSDYEGYADDNLVQIDPNERYNDEKKEGE